jgi:hypothetical protein
MGIVALTGIKKERDLCGATALLVRLKRGRITTPAAIAEPARLLSWKTLI